MKIGWADDQSSIESRKSSSAASAHWRSSITMTTGSRLRESLEEHPPPGEEVVARQVGVGGAEQLRDPRLDEVALLRAREQLVQPSSAAWSRTTSSASCSPMPKRWRTIWMRAQYATPSP